MGIHIPFTSIGRSSSKIIPDVEKGLSDGKVVKGTEGAASKAGEAAKETAEKTTEKVAAETGKKSLGKKIAGGAWSATKGVGKGIGGLSSALLGGGKNGSGSNGLSSMLKIGSIAGVLALLSNEKFMKGISESLNQGTKNLSSNANQASNHMANSQTGSGVNSSTQLSGSAMVSTDYQASHTGTTNGSLTPAELNVSDSRRQNYVNATTSNLSTVMDNHQQMQNQAQTSNDQQASGELGR